MALSYVSAGTVGSSSGTTSTFVAGLPAGTQEGDVLLAWCASKGANTISAAAGWTLLQRNTTGNTDTGFSGTPSCALFYLVHGASAPTSADLTFTRSLTSESTHVRIFAFRGADPSTPIRQSTLRAHTTRTSAAASNPLSAEIDDAVIGFWVAGDDGTHSGYTLSGHTPVEIHDQLDAAGSDYASAVAYALPIVSTLTDATYTATVSTTFQIPRVATVTLQPATETDPNGERTGSLSRTLGAATLSAQVSPATSATATRTLGALSRTAAATNATNASATATLGPLSLEANASSVTARTATLETVLGAASAAGSSAAEVSAALSRPLDAITGSGAATASVDADQVGTLAPVSVTGAATVSHAATLTRSVGALALAGTAALTHAGRLVETLGAATFTATAAAAIDAHLAKTLAVLTSSGTAGTALDATLGAALAPATLAASAGTGATHPEIDASLGLTLGGITAAGSATATIEGGASATLGGVAISGTVAPVAAAVVTAELAPLGAASDGRVETTGAGAAILPGVAAVLVGGVTVEATAEATLGAVIRIGPIFTPAPLGPGVYRGSRGTARRPEERGARPIDKEQKTNALPTDTSSRRPGDIARDGSARSKV